MASRSKRAKHIHGFPMEWDHKLTCWTCPLKEWEPSGYCRAQAKSTNGEWKMVRDHCHSFQLMEDFQRLTRANEIDAPTLLKEERPTKKEQSSSSDEDSEPEPERSVFERRTAELLKEAETTGQLETFECSSSTGVPMIFRGYMVTSICLDSMHCQYPDEDPEETMKNFTRRSVKRGKGISKKNRKALKKKRGSRKSQGHDGAEPSTTSSGSGEDEKVEKTASKSLEMPSTSRNSSPSSNKENYVTFHQKTQSDDDCPSKRGCGRPRKQPVASEKIESSNRATATSSLDDKLWDALLFTAPDFALRTVQKHIETRLRRLEERARRGENTKEERALVSEIVSKMIELFKQQAIAGFHFPK